MKDAKKETEITSCLNNTRMLLNTPGMQWIAGPPNRMQSARYVQDVAYLREALDRARAVVESYRQWLRMHGTMPGARRDLIHTLRCFATGPISLVAILVQRIDEDVMRLQALGLVEQGHEGFYKLTQLGIQTLGVIEMANVRQTRQDVVCAAIVSAKGKSVAAGPDEEDEEDDGDDDAPDGDEDDDDEEDVFRREMGDPGAAQQLPGAQITYGGVELGKAVTVGKERSPLGTRVTVGVEPTLPPPQAFALPMPEDKALRDLCMERAIGSLGVPKDVLEGRVEMRPRPCTCPTSLLMSSGCQCGSFDQP